MMENTLFKNEKSWEKFVRNIANWKYEWGYNGDYDKAEADINELIKKADDGDCKSQLELGNMLYFSRLNPRARKYFRMSADQGNVQAMFQLAKVYFYDDKKPDDAIKYFQMAAENGHAEAADFLGEIYRRDRKDYDEAVKWYRISADLGNTDGMYHLGMTLCNHYSEEKREEAYKFAHMSADAGNSDGQYLLGAMYNQDGDFDGALEYLTLSADQHNCKAMKLLGNIFCDKGDFEEAFLWYDRADNHYDAEGSFLAGQMLVKLGEPMESVKYFKEAAKKGINGADTELKNVLQMIENEKDTSTVNS